METETRHEKVSEEHSEAVTKWAEAVQEASQSLPDGSEWKLAAEHSAGWLARLIASEQEAANAS